MCRSVHAEANAIISASRESMLGSTIYLVGIDMEKGGYVETVSYTHLDESCIQVAIYDDRLEVTSPGGLYNGCLLYTSRCV